ncbi:hypothetical protein ACSBR2_029176 [Camellia fascicularis]
MKKTKTLFSLNNGRPLLPSEPFTQRVGNSARVPFLDSGNGKELIHYRHHQPSSQLPRHSLHLIQASGVVERCGHCRR